MIFILKFCLSGLFWTNFFLKKSKIFDVRFIPSPDYYELYGRLTLAFIWINLIIKLLMLSQALLDTKTYSSKPSFEIKPVFLFFCKSNLTWYYHN